MKIITVAAAVGVLLVSSIVGAVAGYRYDRDPNADRNACTYAALAHLATANKANLDKIEKLGKTERGWTRSLPECATLTDAELKAASVVRIGAFQTVMEES